MRRWFSLGWLIMSLGLVFGLVLSPTTGSAASVAVVQTNTPAVYQFSATGFTGSEVVSTWLTGPSQQVMATGYQEVDDNGAVTFELRMPRHLQSGRWTITVRGLDSDAEAIASFNLPVRGPDVTLSVNPSVGPIGTAFAFSSTGFQPGENVSYWLTSPTGQAVEGDRAVANEAGRVDFVHVVDEGTQLGQWRVSAYGWASDRLGIATITVR